MQLHSGKNLRLRRARSLLIVQKARTLLLCCAIAASALLLACSDASVNPGKAEVYQVSGSTMGTYWSARWVDDNPTNVTEPAAVQQALEAALARINALMSTWDPDSELSEFNASISAEPIELGKETLKVIDEALGISRLTKGRYDVSLKPIIELWGFGRDTSTPTPDEAAIEEARLSSGYRQLVRVGNTIRKRNPELAIDVSSLAKGYAVDVLGKVMQDKGISRFLVDIGGELMASGTRVDGLAWRVGIESPEGLVEQVISLHDTHIASSGSYRNFRMENGKRLSHIIDGATGKPIEHDLVSVNVVHQSTMLADAWATALLVVGEDEAQQLIRQQALTAQLTVYRDGQFAQFRSPDFDTLLVK